MSIVKQVGEAAIELAKNKDVQDKAVGLVGMLAPYIQLKKKAVDLYVEEIEKSDLSTEAKVFALLNAKKTIKKIKNSKSIADFAVNNSKEGTDFSEKSGVDEEWLDRFMDSASYVSSEEMQLVWGKILANEFEKPGSTPPNMTRILSEFTKPYADAFRTLCSMTALVVSVSENGNIINARWRNIIAFNENKEFLNRMGISFTMLNELETMGVIRFQFNTGIAVTDVIGPQVLVYVNGRLIQLDNYQQSKFPVGDVMFTKAGETLYGITEKFIIDGYYDSLLEFFNKNHFTIATVPEYDISVEGESVKLCKKG